MADGGVRIGLELELGLNRRQVLLACRTQRLDLVQLAHRLPQLMPEHMRVLPDLFALVAEPGGLIVQALQIALQLLLALLLLWVQGIFYEFTMSKKWLMFVGLQMQFIAFSSFGNTEKPYYFCGNSTFLTQVVS